MPLTSIVVLAAAAAAQTPTPAPAPAPARAVGSSLQSRFDAATQAADAGDCTRAIGLFQALQDSGSLKPSTIAAAATSVRKGRCMVDMGDEIGGEAAIRAGLPQLEGKAADFGAELSETYFALGTTAFHRFDFALARDWFRKALPLTSDTGRTRALAMLARATAFDPGPEPLAYADEGLRLVAAQGKPGRQAEAAFHTLRGRILLNRGETQAAYAELKQALALSGGLSLDNVSLSEVSMRGDLATTALLLGQKDAARNYLLYTGQGRLEKSPFASGKSMFAPDCGEVSGLSPQDFAIVEFSIAGDGTVAVVTPIYTRGGPRVAAAFARVVRQWSWTPESAKAIPQFYRTATRVELRCSNAAGPRSNQRAPLTKRFTDWAVPIAAVPADGVFDTADTAVALRRKLAASQAASDPAGIAAAAGLLAIGSATDNVEAAQLLVTAIASAGANTVPREVRAALLVFQTMIPQDMAQSSGTRPGPRNRAAMRALLQDPAIAADPLAAATLRIEIASSDWKYPAPADADALLAGVADAPDLPLHHPLRQVAQLELADHAARRGDLPSAQAWFTKTGLTEEQCALIGTVPAMTRTGANSGQYPQEALRYGFEGFIKLEYDVSADGRAINPRAIIAYPPFVFTDSAKVMASGMRFETSYRPAQGKACSARGDMISFVIPKT